MTLSVIPPKSLITPPRPLGNHGQTLWNEIQREYAITDTGGVEVLAQICAALDRAEQLSEAIQRDGALVPTSNGTGMRGHPAIKDELSCRTFIVRSLARLGINVSVVPPRGPGRPPKTYGY
jgi:Phage terminase, small subunit